VTAAIVGGLFVLAVAAVVIVSLERRHRDTPESRRRTAEDRLRARNERDEVRRLQRDDQERDR
jgi:hypothetical protein